MLKLYGHPFSSYTWKARIALDASGIEYEFCIVDDEHPEHQELVNQAGPAGKFPVLVDGDAMIFEATAIIEYLHQNHPGDTLLLPTEVNAAIAARMLDRVFDNYVMDNMQLVVEEHIRSPQSPDQTRINEAKERLLRTYEWLEGWLSGYPLGPQISLIECAAAPALFYADWILPIPEKLPYLRRYRAHLLQRPSVRKNVEAARPYRENFPPGAPDRD